MAARTGASVGVAVAITVLAIFAFTFFVLAVVFFGQAQNAKSKAADAEAAIEQTINELERNNPAIQDYEQAARSENKTLVGYLVQQHRDTMRQVTGEPDMTLEGLAQATSAYRGEGAASGSVFDLLDDKDRSIAELRASLQQAEQDRLAAIERAEGEAARAEALAADFDAQGEELRNDVEAATESVDSYLSGYGDIEARLRGEVDRLTSLVGTTRDDLSQRIQELLNENQLLRAQVAQLRGEGNDNIVRPQDEAALVDGQINAADPGTGEVILSIGRRQKVVLGMTFAVYSTPTDIRVNSSTGEYEAGKGAIEITRVDDNSSRGRIVRQSRGDAIVRGDVIANAVYDPTKVYKVVVYGSFDFNRDGRFTKFERDDVAALITRWGGRVVDDLDGNIDYLILGEEPTIGPPPPPGAPREVIDAYVRARREVDRYHELDANAAERGVPVLNENRLRTLIGDYPD